MRCSWLAAVMIVCVLTTSCYRPGGGDNCSNSDCHEECVATGNMTGHCDGDRCSCDPFPPSCDNGACNSNCVASGNESGHCDGDTCLCVPSIPACDDETCNSGCIAGGNASGHCEDDRCVCVPSASGCEASACNAQCVGAGYSSGHCDGDACICAWECSTNFDCDAVSICVSGHCTLAYGRDYRLTMYGATGIPEEAWGGGAWDVPGGLPDPFLVFIVVGVASHTTATVNDTLAPIWSQYADIRINESTRVRWELWDADLTEHDPIIGAWDDADAAQVSIDFMKAGIAVDSFAGIDVTFYIQPL